MRIIIAKRIADLRSLFVIAIFAKGASRGNLKSTILFNYILNPSFNHQHFAFFALFHFKFMLKYPAFHIFIKGSIMNRNPINKMLINKILAFVVLAIMTLIFSACAKSNANLMQDSSKLSNPPQLLGESPQIQQLQQIPQKLADTPKDTIIKVLDSSGNVQCYMPDVTSIYVVIGTCRTSWAKPARYDVFGRIAYNINDSWFCLTAPESVAETKRKDKDYLTLKPCVINDNKQKWKVKNNLFYALDESYFIKDDSAYLYAANTRDKSLKISKIHNSMNEWISTIATPANLSILTNLAWDYITKDGSERYFLYNDGSSKNTTDLYYNLESGHIAQYDGYKGLNCLYADLGGAQWNWAYFAKCTDAKAPSVNKAYWRFIPISESESILLNHQGAALRVTQNGIHWGVPYIVAPTYLLKDTTNNPTSRFIISSDMQEWLRFIYANIGDNLPYCPAPANTMNLAQGLALNKSTNLTQNPPNLMQNQSQFPPLPRAFSLTESWMARILSIISTNDGSAFTQGVCGVCLLQSFQILAELLENPLIPRTSGGYFFDTQAGTNPFISFQRRNSLLYQTLDDIVEWFPGYAEGESATQQEIFEFNNNLALMSAIALLSQYNWRIIATSQGQGDVARVINTLFSAPQGSAFLLSLRLSRTGQQGGHAMVALRLASGVVLVPTNTTMDMQDFRAFIAPVNTMAEFLARFSYFGFNIDNISLISAEGVYRNHFAESVSLNNCTGFGDGRRGSGTLPQSAFVNQCSGGRCME